MKKLILLILLLSISTLFAQSISEVPYYFALPVSAHAEISDSDWVKIPVRGVKTEQAYLRGYSFQERGANGSEAQKAGRREAFQELYSKGLLQTGDVVLSMRPAWEGTIPYSHIQMGVSHASLVIVEDGVVKNLDMPLDDNYNGNGLNGRFDGSHFQETNHYQILRNRVFTAEQRENLIAWVKELRKNYTSIRGKNLLKFNSNYMAPRIDNYGPGYSFVTTMARIMLGYDKTSSDLIMFCSEYVWAILSLANCSPADSEFKTATRGDSASCVKPIFNAMYLLESENAPGLTEGPLTLLKSMSDVNDLEKNPLLFTLFAQGEIAALSSGHKAIATNPAINMLIEMLKQIYPAKLAGMDKLPEVSAKTSAINAKGGRNYSPTAFLINTTIDSANADRSFDYTATVSFTPYY
ncbi:MAG: hypothetical protein A2504_13930 [Bdellovibrionales bacterium RIFOXYD12_FULL_39_22]|nr:MAG: hypothetical protein A2385_00655 [Bdellovibrionales bacterium RIFOXYB1_FULL_39_21]OFZ43812.1 MAG: hypothetical protein A2485_04875 [Bdellovibrionales bacterium RIFOXYC12_FULL_39_17]OFZ48854.1 MAG: hypothetical protein A2404_17970 [Bdellovibrionales bacterium RIFOXYC1_FULL_39_130]OFZ76587.1 MAG: hypothetical protein A2560_06635 [Bdellovibrionales bacterium RIFOXYD1_FULL_39_84]OFZ94821.1 MAG: hypothetical protein A2504_13930 [Bdellovibrionales bacterium RIFOXYD12_FULL_39_22]HLE12245.1 hy